MILATVALVRFFNNRNFNRLCMGICVGRALMTLMPFRPQSFTNSHTFAFKISRYFFVFQPRQCHSFEYQAHKFSVLTNFDLLFGFLASVQSANIGFSIDSRCLGKVNSY